MLAISLFKLQQLISQAVDAGIQSYARELTPDADRIKKADAKRLVARYGFQPIMIDKWTKANLIHSSKSGEAQNAACWYSVAEIKQAIATMKLRDACDESHQYTIMPKKS